MDSFKINLISYKETLSVCTYPKDNIQIPFLHLLCVHVCFQIVMHLIVQIVCTRVN